ncbi:hypothetical protein SS50377_24053 [Spironucleus salmonicida]|uniref:Uncharacterized protein n=1 Tax=Spironucleus salmonicida TaxID=348837 RepID=V6LSR0_9EUKA|nr:hypothetical protein SS50377_24053 [Spironucleus salmonicida]|eukprot:EST46721.1 Hypothetical protein SS50377_13263 [Spironucleus salmonicida]
MSERNQPPAGAAAKEERQRYLEPHGAQRHAIQPKFAREKSGEKQRKVEFKYELRGFGMDSERNAAGVEREDAGEEHESWKRRYGAVWGR